MIAQLTDRSLIAVTGPDAESFLQNIMTNDITQVAAGQMVYSCLLTPQGQVLHEFFVLPGEKESGGYRIDIETGQRDAFLKRLGFFKLRAKVVLALVDDIKVSAADAPLAAEGFRSFADPRLAGIGYRLYGPGYPDGATDVTEYENKMISLGIPDGGKTIRLEKDVSADVNLDLLNAIAWDKGCFIGQEVAARMYHRNLNKKRLMILENAATLQTGEALKKDGGDYGEVRQKNRDGNLALVQVKIAFLPNMEDGRFIIASDQGDLSLRWPPYVGKNAFSNKTE